MISRKKMKLAVKRLVAAEVAVVAARWVPPNRQSPDIQEELYAARVKMSDCLDEIPQPKLVKR